MALPSGLLFGSFIILLFRLLRLLTGFVAVGVHVTVDFEVSVVCWSVSVAVDAELVVMFDVVVTVLTVDFVLHVNIAVELYSIICNGSCC